MGAQLAQMGMGVADTVMAGRYDSEDLAGVAFYYLYAQKVTITGGPLVRG